MTRKALITGASGFIGRHMHDYLRSLGYDVFALDLVQTPDVAAWDALDFFSAGPEEPRSHDRYDLVVHAAYHVGGRAVIDGNPSVFALNLELDAAMFEWAVRTRQRHVLYFSSSAVYPVELQTGKVGPTRPFLLNEHHASPYVPLLPDARYGWAKLTGEKLAHAAREQDLPVTIVRPFSGYGPDQSSSYPFPAIMERVRQGLDPVDVWGSGDQMRDWIHVSDVVRGAVEAVHEDVGLVNLGTGRGTTMRELIELAQQFTGNHGEIRPLRDMPDGVMERVSDPSAMHAFFIPRVSLEEGIAEYLEFHGV